MQHEIEELTFKILYPLKEGFETIKKSMKRTIKDYKKEDINLVITKVEYRKDHIIAQYEGYSINKFKKILKRSKCKPKYMNIFELICPNAKIDELILKTEKQLEQLYNEAYNVKIVGISRRKSEKKTFVILLVEKID